MFGLFSFLLPNNPKWNPGFWHFVRVPEEEPKKIDKSEDQAIDLDLIRLPLFYLLEKEKVWRFVTEHFIKQTNIP